MSVLGGLSLINCSQPGKGGGVLVVVLGGIVVGVTPPALVGVPGVGVVVGVVESVVTARCATIGSVVIVALRPCRTWSEQPSWCSRARCAVTGRGGPLAPEVVVAPFFVVLVVPSAVHGYCAITWRNRSSAVSPTRFSAFSRSFTPGRLTTIVLPWRCTSGSAMPRPSTRFRMTSVAVLSALRSEPFTGNSTIEMPPWRSRPSTGRLSESIVAMNVPTMRRQ